MQFYLSGRLLRVCPFFSEYSDNINWTCSFSLFFYLKNLGVGGHKEADPEGLGSECDQGACCEIPKVSIKILF